MRNRSRVRQAAGSATRPLDRAVRRAAGRSLPGRSWSCWSGGRGRGADPDYQGPLLYGLDPVIRTTEDPRLLGVERLVLLRRLETLGVDPVRDGGRRPGLDTAVQRRFLERSGVDLERRRDTWSSTTAPSAW